MTGTDLTIYEPPKLLTEREVRLAGQTSNRLQTLRGFLSQGVSGGSVTVTSSNGSASLSLVRHEMEALIDLMIERDEQFLTSLNIELER
jgi:hypothetical protein